MTDITNLPTRRAILAGAATAAAIPAAAALAAVPVGAARADAVLLAKIARALALVDLLNAPANVTGLSDDVDIQDCPIRSAWQDEMNDLFIETTTIPVRTVAGAVAKVRVAARGEELALPYLDPSDTSKGNIGDAYLSDVAAFLAAQIEGGR